MKGHALRALRPNPRQSPQGFAKTIYDAILGNDYNLALVGLLFATLTTILANLIADLFYAWLDPRISY